MNDFPTSPLLGDLFKKDDTIYVFFEKWYTLEEANKLVWDVSC